ncbi:uncharacterized protein B0I36DRAFT_388279 [Microdochium trichocladiopsis]|uniref:NAD(P)-binding domain-containing protein n=1 Tax=Microdochium trichocladiopsis TaxID=1682393 RepID=A0A9P9BK16_9PEZI|nr:uncharacterized protein B0I36DRAFT_388279 [Microdochium trichocladiopsis]KAH7017971.1 hypothetical protein B0I36DRAFT_388279 [Microdochium trichocladiopsis]
MSAPLTVGVIGPAGFTGSHVCVELLGRGHTVVGISRHPEKFGTHPRYVAKSVDVGQLSIAALAEAFSGLDVLICCYGPQPGGPGSSLYRSFIEVVRRIVLAVRQVENLYFMFIGGAGSLHVPGTTGICTADDPDFLVAYRRAIADSEAHTSYLVERLGPMGSALREFRTARVAERQGQATEETRAFIDDYEEKARSQDFALEFIQAVRTTFMFFDGNTSFSWTFVSPPPLYRPGTRTGSYEVAVDDVPLTGQKVSDNMFEGRLTGITAADLAIAVADESERKAHKHQHWTASGDLSDDKPTSIFKTLD